MKKRVKILTLILVAMATIQQVAYSSDELLSINSQKPMRFLIKMDKEFVGGEVQVLSASRELIVSQKMKKRKLSIDFSNARAGEYTVRVLKGSQQQEYRFLKI